MSLPTLVRALLPLTGSALVLALALVVPADAGQQANANQGELIFRKRCASCHGDKGKGGPAHQKPLIGTRSASELATFINKSMPPGSGTPLPQAKKIAAYMYEAFYSPIAQERNRPARVELQRLTVTQFRNAVMDLVSGYHPAVPATEKRGLTGKYYKGRFYDQKEHAFDRVDLLVRFDFGDKAPNEQFDNPYRFAIQWQGSVVAPDTGEYEFVVRTDHATRLYVNDNQRPVIDAWVKSGNETEFKSSIFLLGGRAYPIRLDFSKATQGVDEPKKEKEKPPAKAYITLLWKRPKMAIEPIPTRNLIPEWSPEKFVLSTPFPADDRSIGYERGTSVSKEWDEATTAAALEVAAHVANITFKDAKLFCRQFVEQAFRRPLTPEIIKLYIDRQFEDAPSVESAVKRVVLLTLKSPRFLYREPGKDPYAVASHLSFGLWDTLPDNVLLQAAADGKLKTPEEVQQHAERMANDPRAKHKLRDFLLFWLKVDEVPDIVKSAKRYPGFDESAASDLRTSLEMFLEQNSDDYPSLLSSDQVFLNGRLARLYGVDLPNDAPFQAVPLDPGKRAGVLTHPYMLSRLAYLENSSPIHRGVLIARSMLGRTLKPPPAAFAPLAPSLHPNLTTRERVAMQTKPAMCNTCHSLINPLGFTLEKFDAIGRLRDKDNGKPVDPTGSYKTRAGALVTFAGATDLAKFLTNSDEAQTAFVEKLFHNLVKQSVLAYGPKTSTDLRTKFAKKQYSIRSLMVEIMAATAGRGVQ